MTATTTRTKKSTTKVANSAKATNRKSTKKVQSTAPAKASSKKAKKVIKTAPVKATKATYDSKEHAQLLENLFHTPGVQKSFDVDKARALALEVANDSDRLLEIKLHKLELSLEIAEQVAKANKWWNSTAGKKAVGLLPFKLTQKDFLSGAFPFKYRQSRTYANADALNKRQVTAYTKARTADFAENGDATVSLEDLLSFTSNGGAKKTTKAVKGGEVTTKADKPTAEFYFRSADGAKVGVKAYQEEYKPIGRGKIDVTTLKLIGGDRANRKEILHALDLLAERLRQEIAGYELSDTVNIATPNVQADKAVADAGRIEPILTVKSAK